MADLDLVSVKECNGIRSLESGPVSKGVEDVSGDVSEEQKELESLQEDNQQALEATSKAPPHISLIPPDDCIPVTKDGGVLKKILEHGEPGDQPSLHARCLVHYVGYLSSNGDLFMDTRRDRETAEPVVVVAGRNAAAQETGLCLAAATMARGERALVYIQDPTYGYGRLGSFSFPCVPPDSQLVYEVEMLSWEGIEETDNDSNRAGLLYEERLERAERRRETGNTLFKEGKYKEALSKYAMALSYMDEDFMYQLEGHYLDKAEAIKLLIHLNMAAAQLNIGDYNTAIYNCGQVLNIDPNNVKALFRRGKARHALGRTEEALADLEAALKIDRSDKAIIGELHAIKATIKKERTAQAALFTGVLNASGAAADGTASYQQDAAAAGTPSAMKAAKPALQATPSSGAAAGPGATATSSSGPKAGSASQSAKQPPAAGVAKSVAGTLKQAAAGGQTLQKKQKKTTRPQGQHGQPRGLAGIVLWLWTLLFVRLFGLKRRSTSRVTK